MMGLCSWIVFGFLAGLVARAVTPGQQNLGFIATTLLGVAGAFMGGFLGAVLRGGSWRVLQPGGFIGAVVGSIVLLVLAQMWNRRR
jgi:uncharacterized membrane protein YeaQ/YmgE (transglycosylase-associated protein family)